MRRLIFVGLLASVALYNAPSAKASDDSIRAVVRAQAERQIKEDKIFVRAMRHLSTKKGLQKAKKAVSRQRKSVKLWHDALVPERADTPQVARGRRDLMNALNLYNKGLTKLNMAIRQALHSGGNSGVAKAKAALRNMNTAARRVGRAASRIM
jgi:hypothetical protein